MTNRPTFYSFLSDVETTVSLFHKVSRDEPTAFLFESTDGDSRLARFSFVGVYPLKSVSFQNGTATIRDHRQDSVREVDFQNPLEILKEEMADFSARYNPGVGEQLKQSLGAIPFAGGWVGYMGYGATQYFDHIPQQSDDPFQVPQGYYGLYDTVILYDHLFRRLTFLSYRDEPEANALWNKIKENLNQGEPLAPLLTHEFTPKSQASEEEAIFAGVTGPFNEERFCNTVLEAKKLIQEGQIFQIVVAHRFSTPVSGDTLDIYRTLQAINPSPYAYYLKFPGFVYLGSSPETFVSCHQGKVTLRALAGTRPRGLTVEEDEHIAVELTHNEKELAEHHMLVDLGRNDLGRICQPGSIRVGPIGQVTRYTHVMHMATELTGTLESGKTAFDVFRSCFPRGTVSGAPKIRAMNILSSMEPECRGIYAGVVGYFDFAGNMDGAIAIRSALIKDGMAHVNAGAGVVYDSNPGAEYQETRNKAKSTLKAIKLAQQLSERTKHHAGLGH